MPILRVMLNKLSSNWQVARAVLEDEYKAIATTLNKNVTRFEFVAHLLDVHRTSCGVCPSGLGVRSSRDTAVGIAGSAARLGHAHGQRMRKIYVSASTQTTDRFHLDAPDRGLDLHVPDNNGDEGNIDINEMAFPLAMTFNGEDEELQADVNTSEEKPSNEKGIKQEHHEDESIREKNIEQREEDAVEGWLDNGKSSSPQDLADKQSSSERTIQLSYLLIKEEGDSQEYCDIDVNTSTCESASHQRHEEAIPTQDSTSALRSNLERPNQLSNMHLKQEGVSQEHCDVDMDSNRNVGASQQRHEEAIPAQDIGSDEKTILYNINEPSTSHSYDLFSPEGSSQEQCDTDWKIAADKISAPPGSTHSDDVRSLEHSLQDMLPADWKTAVDEISAPSGSTHSHDVGSSECSSQDILPADENTIVDSLNEPSTSTHIYDVCSLEGSSEEQCDTDGKTILEKLSASSRSSHVSDIRSLEGASQDLFPAGMDSYKKVKTTARSDRRKPLQCPTCNKKYTCKNAFQAHQRKHSGAKPHSETKALPGDKPYQCLKCLQKFTFSSRLKRHLRIHTGEKPFPCSICSKRFSQKGQVKSHMRSHTGEKPYACSFCAKKFSYRIDLSRHIHTHTGKKPFQCVICFKTFSRHDQFSCHMRMHRGEKPYQCNHCSYKCFEKRSLKVHMWKHTGEKPYQCSSCNRSYSRNDALTKHAKTHCEGKQFKCSLCNKAFARKDHLDCHLKKKNLCSRPHI